MNTAPLETLPAPSDEAILLDESSYTLPIEVELTNFLKENLIGQDEGIEDIVATVLGGMFSIKKREKPIANIIISGSTGIGKTKLVQLLNEFFFGKDYTLLKIDGAEYTEQAKSTNIFGGAKIYVGYSDPTPLSDTRVYHNYEAALARGSLHPFIKGNPRFKGLSVFLLDEFEKMHPVMHNGFLGIFDTGKKEFPTGKEVDGKIGHSLVTDFRNTIFICTSNVGERERAHHIEGHDIGFLQGDRGKSGKKIVEQAFKKLFSPELRGRLHHVHFDTLSTENLRKIIIHEVRELGISMREMGELSLTASPQVIDRIVSNIRSEKGGRGVLEAVQTNVERLITPVLYAYNSPIPLHESACSLHLDIVSEGSGEPRIRIFLKKEGRKNPIQSTPHDSIGSVSLLGGHTNMSRQLLAYQRTVRTAYQVSHESIEALLKRQETELLTLGFTRRELDTLTYEVIAKIENPNTVKPTEEEELFFPFALEDIRGIIRDVLLRKEERKIQSRFTDMRFSLLKGLLIKELSPLLKRGKKAGLNREQSVWVGQEIHRIYLEISKKK